MGNPPLYINRDVGQDWLAALPLGRVSDGQPEDHYIYVGDSFRWCLDGAGGEIIGFEVVMLTEFDPGHDDHEELWSGPRFDAPLLALSDATAGEIVAAAKARYDNESTLNRIYFDRAVGTVGEEAVNNWRLCLECGDSMAHYGLGYTLLEIGQSHEAYSHLRHYTEIIPTNAWAWCWLGKACTALGSVDEARMAYRRALALEEAGGFETDAPELLEQLEHRSSPAGPADA